MTNQRIVNFAYFVFTIVMFMVMGQLLAQFWAELRLTDHLIIGEFGIPWFISTSVTAATMFMVVRNEKATTFFREVVNELRQVTWPTRKETITNTMVVVFTVLILAIVLGVFDLVWAKMSRIILNTGV